MITEGKQATVVEVPGQLVFAVEREGDCVDSCKLCWFWRSGYDD